jgi:hypothetical protein
LLLLPRRSKRINPRTLPKNLFGARTLGTNIGATFNNVGNAIK